MPAATRKSRSKAKPRVEPRPRQALGRGLSALIAPQAAAAATAPAHGFRSLPIDRIVPGKGQPRKTFAPQALEELAASIRTQGVLQPIVVRRVNEGYEIVAGERRWRAAAKAGLQEIPAMVKELSDLHAMQVALIENIQRADLDPIEEALAYQNLLQEHGLRHEDLALAVGKNRVSITQSLGLLRLPKPLMAMLVDGKLTSGHARALLVIKDEAKMLRVAEEVVGRGLSVRDAEVRAKQVAAPTIARPAKKEVAAGHAANALVEQLQRALGTKVKLVCNRRGKGQLELRFDSLHQLDDLVDRISRA